MTKRPSFLSKLPPGFLLGAGIILGIALAWGVIPAIAGSLGSGG